MTQKKISPDKITIDSTFRVRDHLCNETVERYIESFHQLPPITVYKVDEIYKLADGEHRLTAAKRLELPEVDAIVREGTDVEAREFALLANLKHGRPLTNREKRRVIEKMLRLHPERANNWIAEDVGCDHCTVHGLRDKLETTCEIPKFEKLVGKDGKSRPRGNSPPRQKFQIETNSLYARDCIEGLESMAANSVDLIFNDLPYDIGVDYGFGQEAKTRHGADYDAWCRRVFEAEVRVLRPGGSLYAMHYPEVTAKWMGILNSMLTFRRWIIWAYATNIGHSKNNWTRSHRTVLFYTKGDAYTFNPLADPQPYRNPDDKRIKNSKNPGVVPYDVWNFELVKNASIEKSNTPNQIPEGLLRRIILTSSNPDDLVVDPTIGSGTAAVVAKRQGRRYLGFDINPDYIRAARKRIDATETTSKPGTIP